MINIKTVFSQILLGFFLLILSVVADAQPDQSSVTPIIVGLLLDETESEISEFSCEFSINNISPDKDSNILQDDIVSADIHYSLNNVPPDVRVGLTAILISSVSDLDDGLPTASLLLTTSVNLTLLDFMTSQRSISSQMDVEAIHSSAFQQFYKDIVVFGTFSRVATEDDLIGIPELTPGESIITIGSGSIPCDVQVSTEVNWLFDGLIN